MEDAESLEDWDSEDSGSVELDLEVSDPDDSEDMEDSESQGELRLRGLGASVSRGRSWDSEESKKLERIGGTRWTRRTRRDGKDLEVWLDLRGSRSDY